MRWYRNFIFTQPILLWKYYCVFIVFGPPPGGPLKSLEFILEMP